MTSKVTITLTLPHQDWIRLRAFGLATRRTLEEVVTDALQADLHRKGVHPPLPAPETFSERLTAACAKLAQLDALMATMEAAADTKVEPPSEEDTQNAVRSPILRQSHVRLPLQQPMTIRPRIAKEIWTRFMGHAYLYGEDPKQTVYKVILDHLGRGLLSGGAPIRKEALEATLAEVLQELAALQAAFPDLDLEP